MKRILGLLLVAAASADAEQYCFGFLNAHPERKPIPDAEAQEIQKGHMAHMNKMALAGHLLTAGPIATPGGPRGILVYRCKTTQEALEWTAPDPAVQNKRLIAEFYKWNGPDGFGEPLLTQFKADQNTKPTMIRLPLMVFRKTEKWVGAGPDDALKEHAGQLNELRRQGKVRAAGPFLNEKGEPRVAPGVAGLFVFAAMPFEEAKAIAAKDALVREGYVRIDAYEWFVADEAVPKARLN
jgi:uncharacterized protein YciI